MTYNFVAHLTQNGPFLRTCGGRRQRQPANRDSSGNRQWWIQSLDALLFFLFASRSVSGSFDTLWRCSSCSLVGVIGGSVRLVDFNG